MAYFTDAYKALGLNVLSNMEWMLVAITGTTILVHFPLVKPFQHIGRSVIHIFDLQMGCTDLPSKKELRLRLWGVTVQNT